MMLNNVEKRLIGIEHSYNKDAFCNDGCCCYNDGCCGYNVGWCCYNVQLVLLQCWVVLKPFDKGQKL